MPKNGQEEATDVATFVAEFDKLGEDLIIVAPGVFIPVEEFITDFQQFIQGYIAKKVIEFYKGS